MDAEQHKAMVAAAGFFNESARKLLTVEGRLHAETLIASVARMAGSLMYRSFGFDGNIEPGTVVISEQANTRGPQLMNVMLLTLQRLGHTITGADINAELASGSISQLSFKESHDRLAPFFLRYCETAPIPFPDAATGAAIATAMLIHDCREVLAVDKGASIAIYGFVEGTKTAPYPLQPGEPQPEAPVVKKKKPWYRF